MSLWRQCNSHHISYIISSPSYSYIHILTVLTIGIPNFHLLLYWFDRRSTCGRLHYHRKRPQLTTVCYRCVGRSLHGTAFCWPCARSIFKVNRMKERHENSPILSTGNDIGIVIENDRIDFHAKIMIGWLILVHLSMLSHVIFLKWRIVKCQALFVLGISTSR